MIIFTLVFMAQSSGQVLCELSLESCVDYTSGQASIDVTVPVNTTRIARSPLIVCMAELTETKNVDFIFIVDQSGSMEGNDAGFLAPQAVQNAIDYLQANSPASNIGFIGFAHGVCDGTRVGVPIVCDTEYGTGPLCDSPVTHLEIVAPLSTNYATISTQTAYNSSNYHLDCGRVEARGTEYVEPLTIAQQWLTGYPSGNSKVIIFLTDGQPYPPDVNGPRFDNFVDSLINNNLHTSFATVYSLFIGGTNDKLEELSDSTNGASYFEIQPEELSDIMQGIVQETIAANPYSTTVTNATNGRSGTADAAGHSATGTQGEYSVTLANVVALNENVVNAVTFSTEAYNTPVQSMLSNISVTGAEITDLGQNMPDVSPFQLSCMNATKIVFQDSNFSQVYTGLIDFQEERFGITLQTGQDLPAGQQVQLTGATPATAVLDSNLQAAVNSSGTLGATVTAAWTNPHDPRDTATATITLGDPTEDNVAITFMTPDGTPVTGSLSDAEADQIIVQVQYNKPYLGSTLTVDLTTDDGDTLQVTVTQIETGSEIFQGIAAFGFTQNIITDDQEISGLLDPLSASNTAVITARVVTPAGNTFSENLTITSGFVPVSRVWIIDGDQNGRADTIFIEYSDPVTDIPEIITDIHWPDNSSETKTAGGSRNPITLLPGSSTTVVIDLSQDEFAFGATGASTTDPPTLTLENGTQVIIEDGMGAVVVEAEKVPSTGAYIMVNGNDSIPGFFPDTIVVTLSEPIEPSDAGASIGDLFRYIPSGGTEEDAVALEVINVEVSDDGLTWRLITPHEVGGTEFMEAGDSVYLNPNASYQDAAGNPPEQAASQSGGNDYIGKGANTYIVEPVLGAEAPLTAIEGGGTGLIPIVDVSGNIIDNIKVDVPLTEWIPPVGMNDQGVIMESNQAACNSSSVDNQNPATYNPGCLSILLVLTKEPYTATINIYDNLGKHLHASRQSFGYCGELQNTARLTNTGMYRSYLIWNQRTPDDRFVGSGVYIWKVGLKFKSGRWEELVKRQGVARTLPPSLTCAVEQP
ncbi:hypothetical protein ACFL5V_03565 [Fibrobacterota bacterium]